MAAAVGAPQVERLLAAGLLLAAPLADGDSYPCDEHAEPGCCRVVVREPGGVRAVCGLHVPRCEPVEIAPEDAVTLRVDPVRFQAALARALGLAPVAPETPDPVRPLVLGDRCIGATVVRFLLVPRPRRTLARHGLTGLVPAPDGVLVVLLAFHPEAVPAAARAAPPPGAEWLLLSDVLRVEGTAPVADLSTFLLRHRFPGVDLGRELWPPWTLVVDEGARRFHYGGRPLDLDRHEVAARLLVALARQAGRFVPRRDLLVAVWPDEFSVRGKARMDLDALDRRLRQTRSVLSDAFRALPPRPGLVHDPVENLRARSDEEGGYRLAVEAGRVMWV